MDLVAHYQAMARYNTWMNDRLYACCGTLSDEERKRDLGAFFRSLHTTLNHLLVSDRAWLWRFTGDRSLGESRDSAGNVIPYTRQFDQEVYADFAELTRERARTDAAIEHWTARLEPAQLASTLRWKSRDGSLLENPFWIGVTHFFNHQTHHRGQVTTLLKQLGRDPGVTDLVRLFVTSA